MDSALPPEQEEELMYQQIEKRKHQGKSKYRALITFIRRKTI